MEKDPTIRELATRRQMSRRKVLAGGGFLLGFAAVPPLLAACGSSSKPAQQTGGGSAPQVQPTSAPTSAPTTAATAAAGAQVVTMYVFRGEEGIKGPDGKGHDAFVPSSMVVKAGQPVTVSVINSDEGPHTITCAGLKLDQEIKGGNQLPNGEIDPVTTTFTFTAPAKGVYRWDCERDCDAGGDKWAMSDSWGGKCQPGFMAGNIVVI